LFIHEVPARNYPENLRYSSVSNDQDMESILEVEKIPALSSERETIDYFWVKK
jgi:hypothetical protein